VKSHVGATLWSPAAGEVRAQKGRPHGAPPKGTFTHRQSDLVESPPHPDPLHNPSKTGVNALKASGEREQKDLHLL
jgi:hypothetical protein